MDKIEKSFSHPIRGTFKGYIVEQNSDWITIKLTTRITDPPGKEFNPGEMITLHTNNTKIEK